MGAHTQDSSTVGRGDHQRGSSDGADASHQRTSQRNGLHSVQQLIEARVWKDRGETVKYAAGMLEEGRNNIQEQQEEEENMQQQIEGQLAVLRENKE